MQQVSQRQQLMTWLVVVIDLVGLNLGLALLCYGIEDLNYSKENLLCWNFSYLVSVLMYRPVVVRRTARSEQVAGRCFQNVSLMQIFFLLSTYYINRGMIMGILIFLSVFMGSYILLLATRLFSRFLIKMLRRIGQDNSRIVFVGSSSNIVELYQGMRNDISTGYRIKGYFDDAPSALLKDRLTYLGNVSEVIPYLKEHEMDQLYCALPSARSVEIRKIIGYCENHLIRFYSVPNVRNYLKRKMMMTFVNDVPVLSIRREPLRALENRLIKRTFDIVFSLLFLCTLFIPVFLVVAICIKVSSPGPIFFRQKRNGLNGKEFWCLKFRSMKVNKDADLVQATEHDPRKFPFGDFMRRTNIDELPQFINVLIGTMSIVGPRPHMLKHTEEYSALIDHYMVRHFAKPGITGWAQVQGCRGETKELYQMENRIEKDVWYVENWSFWLDLRIIYMTVRNMLMRNEENAY